MRRRIVALGFVALLGLGGAGWGHASVAQASTYPNSTCPGGLIAGGTYNNVTVLAGQVCQIVSATIYGNLEGQAGTGGMDVEGLTHIYGNVEENGAAGLSIGIDQATVIIGGNLQVTDLARGATVFYAEVLGNGQFDNNAGVFILGSSFGGNLEVDNNTLGSNLTGNYIARNLSCQNNVPPPTSYAPNTAKSYSGQCTA